METRRIVAVLAGGEGRRMGGVKALRSFRGGTLLSHALAQARSWSSEIVLVLRDPAQAGLEPGAPVAIDAPGIEGPLAALAAALRHGQARGADLVFTMPCDTPDLPADLPARLAGALAPGVAVVLPEVCGQLEPALGLWRVQALGALDAYLATGGRSLHGFASAAGLAKVVFGQEAAAAFANANTPEVLAKLERRED